MGGGGFVCVGFCFIVVVVVVAVAVVVAAAADVVWFGFLFGFFLSFSFVKFVCFLGVPNDQREQNPTDNQSIMYTPKK